MTLCQGGSWALLLEEWSLSPPDRALKPPRRVAEHTDLRGAASARDSVYLFSCSYVTAAHRPLAERLSNIFICGVLNARD